MENTQTTTIINDLNSNIQSRSVSPEVYTLTIDPNGGYMPNGDNQYETNIFTTQFSYGSKTYMGNLYPDTLHYNPYNTPTRVGYTFKGFHFSNGSGQLNTSGDNFYFNGGKYGNGIGHNANTWVFNGDYAGDVVATAIWINWDETEIIIDNQAYEAYIYNGNEWDQYIPYYAEC